MGRGTGKADTERPGGVSKIGYTSPLTLLRLQSGRFMAGKQNGQNTKKNHMALVTCPVSGSGTPANSTKTSGEYRCTKCGQLHGRKR